MALAAPESVTSYKQERKYLIFGVEAVLVIGTKISDFWSSYGTES